MRWHGPCYTEKPGCEKGPGWAAKRREDVMRPHRLVIALSISMALVFIGCKAHAACGCDHPARCPAPAMPGFAASGNPVRVAGADESTEVGGMVWTSSPQAEPSSRAGRSSSRRTRSG